MNNEIQIGQQIVKAHAIAGLSTNELAEKVGVETAIVQNWEDGTREPRANRVLQLAGILTVPFAWLMAGDVHHDYELTDLNETTDIQNRLNEAEQLLAQLTTILDDIRQSTRQVQEGLDN